MNPSTLKQTVLTYTQKAFAAGLFAGTSGNLSARGAGNVIAITPSGVRYETLTVEDIVLLDLDTGALVEQTRRRESSETPLHLHIYRNRPDVGAVVHTHSPYATAFAAGGVPIPCALVEMIFYLGGQVPVAPMAYPGTDAVGIGAVEALEGRSACLLQNHGAVTVGANMQGAYIRAEYVEDAAKICLLARQNGSLVEIDPDMVTRILSQET